MMKEGNPIIRNKYTADPTVLVHNQTVYLYTGHDDPPAGVDDYNMQDWLCFSSTDLIHWTEHPSPLKATDFKWTSGDAYASKVVAYGGKFYWFVSVTQAGGPFKSIGVAVSDHPTGPFTDAKGAALVTVLSGRWFAAKGCHDHRRYFVTSAFELLFHAYGICRCKAMFAKYYQYYIANAICRQNNVACYVARSKCR